MAWLGESLGGNAEAVFRAGEAVGRDRRLGESAVESWWLFYRDMLCARAGGDLRLKVMADAPAAALEHAAQLSLDDMLSRLGACREAWQALQGNVSPRLTVEVLLSRLGRERGTRAI
jgi:hypothetical protein